MNDGQSEKKKQYGESTLELLRDIKKALDKSAEESNVPCILVSTIEKEVKKDPRTVRHHLRILEEAEYGRFSNDGKLFCPRKAEERAT